MDDAGDAVDDRGPDLRDVVPGADSPSSRDLVSSGQDERDQDEQEPMQRVPMPSQTPSPVSERQADAAEREDQADERAEVLQEDDRQLGGLGAADELLQELSPRTWLDSLMAVRKEKHSAMIAKTRTPTGQYQALDRVRVLDLLVALVDGEHAADGEQHDGDEEGVDVALAAVAEGVLRGGLRAGPSCRREQQDLVAGVGERVDASASIDEEPLKQERHEFAAAIARLAASAATIALVPPFAAKRASP